MLFSIFILIAIAVIAYFHYAQGFFSATISAILAIFAAVLSVSYSETIVNTLLKGKMADNGQAVMLLMLFFGIYLISRIIFDMAVPGNLRFPSVVDAVGGAIMGLVAGIMATGVVALAAQSMGFGPAIGGYALLPIHGADRAVVIKDPNHNMFEDAVVSGEVDADKLDPGAAKTMIVPVDNVVLGLVQHLSDDGSLAGDRSLDSVHPNWPLELFGQRMGIQVGSKRTALNFPPTLQWVKLSGVYSVASLPEVDGEMKAVRGPWTIPAVARPTANQALLIVRVDIDHAAGDDTDGVFRFSCGSVRLVANKKDNYPIGTVYNGTKLLAQKPDDPLFLDLSAGPGAIDFAFMVDASDVLTGGKAGVPKVADGVFVSVKRYGIVDLSGASVKLSLPTPTEPGPIRKSDLAKEKGLDAAITAAAPAAESSTPAPPPTAAPAPAAPLAEAAIALVPSSAKVSAELPRNIGVTTTDVNAQNVNVAGGTVSLTDSRMAMIRVDPTATLDKLAAGDNQIPDLFVADGKKMIQVSTGSTPPTDWASTANSIKLTDANGTAYACNGVYALVKNGDTTGFFVRYDAKNPISGVGSPGGTASTVTYLFVVPSGTAIKGATGAGAPVTLSVTAQ